MTTANGNVILGKEAVLAKPVSWSSANEMDVKVIVFGDTAIAIGVFKGTAIGQSGTPVDALNRWTDTWIKTASQCIAVHDSPFRQS